MAEELTPIERYRAAWKPNKERINKLRRMIRRAEASGKYFKVVALSELLWAEMLPPRHLPIKNLDRT